MKNRKTRDREPTDSELAGLGMTRTEAEVAGVTITDPDTVRPRKWRIKGDFVTAPVALLTLVACKAPEALALACCLCWHRHLQHDRHKRPKKAIAIQLSNAEAAHWGMRRNRKYRTLKQLEELDLVSVTRAGKETAVIALEGPLWFLPPSVRKCAGRRGA
jgi:hypothetical protein